MQITSKNAKGQTAAGVGNVRMETPSVDKHSLHTPTQLRLARSLARTIRTRNETETDFPIDWGSPASMNSPESPICTELIAFSVF